MVGTCQLACMETLMATTGGHESIGTYKTVLFPRPYVQQYIIVLMVLSIQGEITWQADPQAPPFAPQPLPPYPSASRMLYMWVGQYVPQSFIYAAQHHGFLQYNLTTKDVSPAMSFQ